MSRKGAVLVVDDEPGQREVLTMILRSAGYEVEAAATAKNALAAAAKRPVDLVLTDLKLTDMDGLGLLDRLLASPSPPCVVMMTAYGTIDSAVQAMRKGAFYYLTKPLDRNVLLLTISRAFEQIRLREENRSLSRRLEERLPPADLIGEHPNMMEIFSVIKKAAPSMMTVLICGESGTGKELVARAIHDYSLRKAGPFIAVNCAAIPEALIENELFGHEKGAYTGAAGREIGLFEAAEGGTILLDEIGDLSLSLQAKLLRLLQDKTVRRLGGRSEIPVDVRVLASTNKHLVQVIADGKFREDLYYRINGLTLTLPPLRERATDLPALVRFFIGRYNARMGKQVTGLSPQALRILMACTWPGNVRQLESTIERAMLLCEGATIEPSHLPAGLLQPARARAAGLFQLPEEGFSLEEFEKELIIQAMEQSRWVAAKAARRLGLSYKTLQYRLEKFQIKPPQANASNETSMSANGGITK
ncbi:MAG TPA: sigma-54 dependent transcriptional regulator [Nitrospiria bacterium]|nr:sigma-54 dependent transcriptional regulator [Nitrospiria bacterium]